MIGVPGCMWLLYVTIHSWLWRSGLKLSYTTHGLHRTTFNTGSNHSYTLLATWMFFDVIWNFITKYERICDNQTVEDAMSHGFESVYTLSFLLT